MITAIENDMPLCDSCGHYAKYELNRYDREIQKFVIIAWCPNEDCKEGLIIYRAEVPVRNFKRVK